MEKGGARWVKESCKEGGRGWSQLISDSGQRYRKAEEPPACSETSLQWEQSLNWCLRRRTSTYLQGGTFLLRDTGANAKTSRTGRYVRGTSRPLCCAVTGAQTRASCTWFVWLGLCTGTCGAGVKSAADVHIQWDRGDGAPCAGRGSTAICSGPRAPQGPTWTRDVAACPASFLESCRIPCLSLEPLLCGCWENLGRTCGFRGLKCLRGT